MTPERDPNGDNFEERIRRDERFRVFEHEFRNVRQHIQAIDSAIFENQQHIKDIDRRMSRNIMRLDHLEARISDGQAALLPAMIEEFQERRYLEKRRSATLRTTALVAGIVSALSTMGFYTLAHLVH